MAKKVYVRPLVTKKKKSRVEKDILLITHAGRVISKAAKKVKAFEAQLIAKKLKAKREKLQKLIQCEQERNEKILKLEASATAKLSLVRGFDVQQIIPRALRVMGLGEHADGALLENESAPPVDTEIEKLASRIMQHSSMQKAIDSMDDLLTERRREQLALFEGQAPPPRVKKSTEANARKVCSSSGAPVVNHRSSRTVFLGSLSGGIEEVLLDSDSDTEPAKQKNRPGQRARQARHQLQEMKKKKNHNRDQHIFRPDFRNSEQQRKWPTEESHARPSYKTHGNEPTPPSAAESSLKSNGSVSRERVGSSSGRPPETHPSWAAKILQRAKQGTPLFQGKKTTFS